ncbi:hypothetical protein IMSAGC006_02259 [Muribaculaceae bacterium]|nr:hypothetical protein IMSAGC006_02259 [Muribaculaceae bacterium]
MSVLTSTPAGKVRFMASSSASMRAVSAPVPVANCLVTVMSTAGSPRSEAVPMRGCAPATTVSDTSASVTVPFSSDRITARLISEGSAVDMSPLIRYSLP